jgi:hypothetical protein
MKRTWIAAFFAAAAVGLSPAQEPGGPGAAKAKGKAKGVGLFQRAQTASGPVPRLPDGTIDLSGVWTGGGSNSGDITRSLKPGDTVEMLPAAEAIFKSRQAKDDPELRCLPTGVPRNSPYPWRMVQTPTHVPATHIFILHEGNIHSYRQIFMNAKHPEDPDPTWYGHSIGSWDGDTLVVDTVGFNDKFWFDYLGHPHTERLHTIERYTRTDLGNMTIEVTIDDPGAYRKPFTTTGRARLLANEEIMEYICQENNTNLPHISGAATTP